MARGKATKADIIKLTQNLPSEWSMPPEWKMSEKGREAIRVAVSISNTKHGLFASVPIVCRGRACPYIETCGLEPFGLAPDGERCPTEIADAMKAFKEYSEEFEIDTESRVDMGLLKELIDIEITQDRASKILSKDGTFIQDVATAVTERGDIITKPEIHKAAEIKDKLSKRKHEILRLFNATRKDKAGTLAGTLDPSTYAAELLRRAREIQEQNMVEAEFEVDDDDTSKQTPK